MTAAAVIPPTCTHPAVKQAWLEWGPAKLAGFVAEHAPGPAGDHADTWLGQVGKGDGGGHHPALWRIGTAQLPGHPDMVWPVAVPLLDDAHLQIDTTPATQATAHHLVEALAMRVLSALRPGLVNVHVWDAREVRGSLPGLYPLLPEGLLTPHDPPQLGDLLDELTARIAEVRSRVLVHGHRSLRDQACADNDGVRVEPWTLVVLFGDRLNLPPALHSSLQRVGRAALTAGISLITVDVPVALPADYEQIVLDGDRNRCSMTGPRVRFIPDLPLDPRRLSQAATAIATWYGEWRIREASFRDLLPAEHGGCTSIESVAAPVGFTEDHTPVIAELGDATPHALIGGPSGTGKTNLILAWIMALASRYSPDELALYLLDFKEGVSFAPLAGGPSGEGWLPHARLVGVNINDDREFGLALLRYLSVEQKRRAAAAKKVGVTKLAELRRADPDGHWPRIVAVLDEAQALLEPRGDPVTEEAVELLEDLARRGRSQGIHLVLASQNLSAVKALWSRAALLEQFSLRIALPRARGVLAETNRASADLARFHAIVNSDGGVQHGNITARVPNACTPGTADQAQAELFDRWGDPDTRPVLLDGDVLPAAHTLWAAADIPTVMVGRGFTVDGAPATARLDAMPGRNLAVLGAGAHQAPRVLSCAAAGLARQGVALDLVTFEHLGAAHADWVATHAPDARRVDAASFADHLTALTEEIEARLDGAPRPPRAVVIFEVDAMESRYTAKEIDRLKTVLHHGPEVGIHVLGWWRSVDRLLKFLTGGAVKADDLGIWAVCDVVGRPIGSTIPGMVANGWEPREARGFLYDRERAAEGRQLFMVPTRDGDTHG
jgi:hypothetical protein